MKNFKQYLEEEKYSFEDHARIAKMHALLTKNGFKHNQEHDAYIKTHKWKNMPKGAATVTHEHIKLAPKGHWTHYDGPPVKGQPPDKENIIKRGWGHAQLSSHLQW